MYHSVDAQSAKKFRRWVVHPDTFSAHMQYLKDQSYNPITVTQFVEYVRNDLTSLPDRAIIITFDDAFADFYTYAWPILQSYKFPATLYIPTKYVNQTSLWLAPEDEEDRLIMTWEQIEAVSQAGIECGAHSQSHPQLDMLSLDEAWEEIFRSKQIIEDKIQKEVKSFAYPHGLYNRKVRELVISAGFSSACAVKHAMSFPQDDLFALRRITIEDFSTKELEILLAGKNLFWSPYERFKNFVWYIIRKSRQFITSAV
jgi:peptidoglycan/xylan/chitin deacetylase (PgdA/CDA1 family)